VFTSVNDAFAAVTGARIDDGVDPLLVRHHAVVEYGDKRFTVHNRALPVAGERHLVLVELGPFAAAPYEHELRSAIQQLQDLVDNSTALMYIKDRDLRYLTVNDCFSRVFGVPSEEIVGRTDAELFTASIADTYAQHDRLVMTTGRPIEVEEPYGDVGGHGDTTRRWLSIKFPLLDEAGTPYGMGAISTDITDRKRAELDARDARLEAERANRSKDEFLSRMSHELRTPLNAILGFAQLLQNQALGVHAARQVDHILEAGNHVLALVNDALDISWIDAGAPGMTITTLGAAETIHQALEIVRPLAVVHDIEIASDLHGAIDRSISGDPQRLRQVFINLLSNAVKFNRPHGYVRVSCRVDDDTMRYRVTDTGEGLSADDASRLFQPFARLPGATDVEGSGLGLALSRRFVEQMGGTIGIERTAPGEGSTFFVDMPIVSGERDPGGASARETITGDLPRLRDCTIVQIEDTPANQRLIQSILDAIGNVELHTAATGRDGIDLVRRSRPDIVVLDLNLPDISGVEVLGELRADPDLREVPVVVMSAEASPARTKQLHALGIAGYIIKPINVRQFADLLVRLLG
jgi:PAS domain S-box-containing protein